MKTTVEKVKERKEMTESDQVVHLRNQIDIKDGEIKKLKERLGEQKEFAEQCSSAIVAVKPFPPFHFTRSKTKPEVVAVIKLSDWHIGERVNEHETEGFNVYNWSIAQARIFQIVTDFLRWVDTQRQAYVIRSCFVLGEGDYVSGDIHEELRVTNEFPLPEQTAKAGLLLGEVCHRISSHFETLNLKLVGADNHGRLNKKPQAKQKTSNNMSFLVHTLATTYLERCNNIRVETAVGTKLLANIFSYKFLIEHGDNIKAHMGIPYYGFQRLLGKEAARRMNTDKGFHYQSIAHWHVPALIDGRTIVNGSLSGTSEFDHGYGRHAAPCQVGFLVGRHGMFNIVPFQGVK